MVGHPFLADVVTEQTNKIHVKVATPTELTFIRHLQAKLDDQIGYIPPAATLRELEWGHVLFGHTETSAQDFAWIHFKECFPVSASRLQKVDDFFYTQKPRDQPQPTGGA